jgi:hypothetical protein
LKLSKKSWLIIAIGIFVIAFAGLWLVYSEQLAKKGKLERELNAAQVKLNAINIEQLERRQSDLAQQLDQTLASSRDAREVLSQPMESLTVSTILFDIAEANGVNIKEINSSGTSKEDVYGVNCQTLPITAQVEGELTNLVAFVTQLNNDMATGVVKSVEITITGAEKATASMQMVIYSQKS